MQTEADVHNGQRCVKTSKRIRIVGTAGSVKFGQPTFRFHRSQLSQDRAGSGSQCRLLDRNTIWTAHHAINRQDTKPVRRHEAGSMMWDAIELARRSISPTRDGASTRCDMAHNLRDTGATLRQYKVAVVVAERIEPDQGNVVGRRDALLAIGLVKHAPSHHRSLRLLVRQSILSRSISGLSGNRVLENGEPDRMIVNKKPDNSARVAVQRIGYAEVLTEGDRASTRSTA